MTMTMIFRKQTETVLELTKAITQQILESRGLIGPDIVLPDFFTDKSEALAFFSSSLLFFVSVLSARSKTPSVTQACVLCSLFSLPVRADEHWRVV